MGINATNGMYGLNYTPEQATQVYRNLTGLPPVTTPSFQQQLTQDTVNLSTQSEQNQGGSGLGTVATVVGSVGLLAACIWACKTGQFSKIGNWFKNGAKEAAKEAGNKGELSAAFKKLLKKPKNKAAYDLLVQKGMPEDSACKLIKRFGADKAMKKAKAMKSAVERAEAKLRFKEKFPELRARAEATRAQEKINLVNGLSQEAKQDAAFKAFKAKGMSDEQALEAIKETAKVDSVVWDMSVSQLRKLTKLFS